jgi:hypothetical protein
MMVSVDSFLPERLACRMSAAFSYEAMERSLIPIIVKGQSVENFQLLKWIGWFLVFIQLLSIRDRSLKKTGSLFGMV